MRKRFSPCRPAGLVMLLLLWSSLASAVLGAPSSRLDPRLLDELSHSPGGRGSFLVFLEEQADLGNASTLKGKTARAAYVYQSLRGTAERSQASLRAELDARGVPYHPYFIVNALQVSGDLALAERIAGRPEVQRVVADPTFSGLDDPPAGPAAPAALNGVEWNVARVHAPQVWSLGYTGQGIVVASCDTGVDWDHPALVQHYRGSAGNHDYDWYDVWDEYDVPTDPSGHGTHTVGTMVGDDGGGNRIGVAPGAQWIACKVSSAGGLWQASKYIACWEWFLAPTRVDGSAPDPSKAPHVINNSWTCPASEGCDPDTLREATQALYAAGIAVIKSAGNAGYSGCGSITNPAQYPESLAVGAFDSGDAIAGFSSRGPVIVDGNTLIKPNVAAPGVSVRSSLPGTGYGSMLGTSMAAPHVSGLIALLWSAQPLLIGDLEATFHLLESSAEPKVDLQCLPNGPAGRPNNVWGWGIVDALAAVNAAVDSVGVLSGTIAVSGTAEPIGGATVAAYHSGHRFPATSGPGGTYSLTLWPGPYTVTASARGYHPGDVESATIATASVTLLDAFLQPAPLAVVTPTLLGATLEGDTSFTISLSLRNEGHAPLSFTNTEDLAVAWLEASPLTGTLDVGQQGAISVTLATAGLAAGRYTATLQVRSNDPLAPMVPVAVRLRLWRAIYLPLLFRHART